MMHSLMDSQVDLAPSNSLAQGHHLHLIFFLAKHLSFGICRLSKTYDVFGGVAGFQHRTILSVEHVWVILVIVAWLFEEFDGKRLIAASSSGERVVHLTIILYWIYIDREKYRAVDI